MSDASDVEIRAFESRDADGVCGLWRTIFSVDPPWNEPEEVIALKMQVQPELFLVATRRGQIIGTVVAGFDGVRGWIHKLAVAPNVQGAGIARHLMNEAELRLQQMGCTKVNLQIRATNAHVQAFYEKLSYAAEDRISMAKRLTDD
ncbi:MAG: GNAT family acetyltransferase [Pseudomonadales bacterium]